MVSKQAQLHHAPCLMFVLQLVSHGAFPKGSALLLWPPGCYFGYTPWNHHGSGVHHLFGIRQTVIRNRDCHPGTMIIRAPDLSPTDVAFSRPKNNAKSQQTSCCSQRTQAVPWEARSGVVCTGCLRWFFSNPDWAVQPHDDPRAMQSPSSKHMPICDSLVSR